MCYVNYIKYMMFFVVDKRFFESNAFNNTYREKKHAKSNSKKPEDITEQLRGKF